MSVQPPPPKQEVFNTKFGKAMQATAEGLAALFSWALVFLGEPLRVYNLKVGNSAVAVAGLWVFGLMLIAAALIGVADPYADRLVASEEKLQSALARMQDAQAAAQLAQADNQQTQAEYRRIQIEEKGKTPAPIPKKQPTTFDTGLVSIDATGLRVRVVPPLGTTSLALTWWYWDDTTRKRVPGDVWLVAHKRDGQDNVIELQDHAWAKTEFGTAWVSGRRLVVQIDARFPDGSEARFRGENTLLIP